MLPTILSTDILLLKRFKNASSLRSYSIGDVVAFVHPTKPDVLLVRRIRATVVLFTYLIYLMLKNKC